MANNTSILDAFERNKYNLDEISQKSRGWYDQEVRKIQRQQHTPQKLLRGNPRNVVQRVYPGKMYMFMYDPVGSEELPYYDKFPLVIPWRRTPTGFIGLNLHYLPYNFRVQLLDRLMVFATNKKMTDTTRLKYSWDLINGIARYKAAKPCVKQYLNTQVRSQFRMIPISDWATAVLLPVERFEKMPKEQVFAESLRTMRR
jgi:hypothetical protein